MPRPTMYKGKTLLNHLDSEEKKKIEKGRQFTMPMYRSGDVMEVTLFSSISEGTYNTFKGLVYGKAQENNLRHSIWLNTVLDSTNTSIKIKANSPMVAKVKVLAYGSNRLRKKMPHIPHLELSATKLQDPIKKGRGAKPRRVLYQ